MYKITEKYKDWLGNERTEDFYFNISESDLTKMQFSKNGGFDAYLKKIISAQDQKSIMEVFEQIIDLSYGEISGDGRSFLKGGDILESFKTTVAYSQIFMRLVTNSEAASEFINNVFPKDMIEKAAKDMNGGNVIDIKEAANEVVSTNHSK